MSNTQRILIGIDPGKSGGIAWIRKALTTVGMVGCQKMPPTAADIADALQEFDLTLARVAVEQIGVGIPGRRGSQGMAKLNRNYGTILGVLAGLRIPHETVTAGKWQKAFGLTRTSKTETQTAKKNRHKAKAQQLFPKLKITHATADALLIAEWLRRRELGENK